MAKKAKQKRKSTENIAAGQEGLQFLRDWLSAVGMNLDEAAAALGKTRQTLWMALCKIGDLKLSDICAIVAARNCRVVFFLTQDPADLGRRIGMDDSRCVRRPELGGMTDTLAFFRMWMRRYGISAADIAGRTGLSEYTVRYYLSTSDMYFQRLMQIVREFSATLRITIEPVEDTAIRERDLPGPGAGGYLVSEFMIRKSFNLTAVAEEAAGTEKTDTEEGED